MDESSSPDHLSSSLTDLMTSLMVIFILLLLVFLVRKAGEVTSVTEALLRQLQQDPELHPQGANENMIRLDPHERNAILVVVPDRLMNFETGKSTLRPDGEQFLQNYIPKFANVLCGDKFKPSIESIVVEGHTDTQAYRSSSPEESQNLNLKLSQDRSMEVVKNALTDLMKMDAQRACFLEKLSATGRGEQDPEATAEESRRVIFRIRVKAKEVDEVKAEVK